MQILIQKQWGNPRCPWRAHISGFKLANYAQSSVHECTHEDLRMLEDLFSDMGEHDVAAGLSQYRAEHEAYLKETVDKSLDALTTARGALKVLGS